MRGLRLLMLLLSGVAMANADDQGEAVGLARTHLAQQLSVPEDRLRLEAATPVDWPSPALGCPAKGMMYAQVITPGYRVSFRLDEQRHEVHVGGGRAVVCGPAQPVRGASVLAGLRMYGKARQDLAARLEVPEAGITGSWKAVKWPDAALGCPEPGRSYAPAERQGFDIKLESGGKVYRYHADAERLVACDAPSGTSAPKP